MKRTIFNALPIVAAAYGEKFGVKVEIGDREAYTDGQRIVLPNVPEDYPDMDVIWGYLAHEAAHVRFTDFDTVKANRRTEFTQTMLNVFEDCRIERSMIRTYPGTSKTLNSVAAYMASEGHYEIPDKDTHPAMVVVAYCLYWLQCHAVGQSVLQPFADDAEKVLLDVVPQGVVARLNTLIRKAPLAESTAEALDLAYQVEQLIRDAAEEQKNQAKEDQPKPQQGNDQSNDPTEAGKPDSAMKKGEGEGEGDDDDASGQEAQRNPAGNAKDGQGQDAPCSDDKSGQKGDQSQGKQGANGNQAAQDAAQFLESVLSAAGGDCEADKARQALKDELFSIAQSNQNSNITHVRTAVEGTPNALFGSELLTSVAGSSNKLKQQLYGLVQSKRQEARRYTHTGKKFDQQKIARLACGDTRVFEKKSVRTAPNTAVHLLLDTSGSMNVQSGVIASRPRIAVAREACLALALALEAIPNVNPAVTGFGGNSTAPVVSIVKHGSKSRARAGHFPRTSAGSTPMAEALWYGAFELSKCREERKIIIVLTDGEPDSSEKARYAIDLCEKSGIEVIGIGINLVKVSDYFKKHIVINDLNELTKTLFKLMENVL